MISSTAAKTEMVLENTRRDFVNLQDRCRVVIARRIRHKSDVAKLCLPPRIQAYLGEIIDERYIDPYKLVNQTIDYLEMNFLTSIPGDPDGLQSVAGKPVRPFGNPAQFGYCHHSLATLYIQNLIVGVSHLLFLYILRETCNIYIYRVREKNIDSLWIK